MPSALTTLGSLRLEMAGRLGFAMQIGALGDAGRAIDGWIRSAQEQRWHEHTWPELERDVALYCDVGQGVVDWPDDCDPSRLGGVWVVEAGDTDWRPLRETYGGETLATALPLDVLNQPGAVPTSMPFGDFPPHLLDRPAGQWVPLDAVRALERTGRVEGYERRQQLRLVPPPAQRVVVRLRYLPRPPELTDERTPILLPKAVVLELAVAKGKAHLRHPDAAATGQMADRIFAQVRGRAHGDRRYPIQPITGWLHERLSPTVSGGHNGGPLLVPTVGLGRR